MTGVDMTGVDTTGVGVRRAQSVLGAAGVAIGLVGVYAFATAVPSRQWLGVFTWLAEWSSPTTP